MAELSKYFERDDLGGGKFRLTQNLKPIAFLTGGSFQRIVDRFIDGDVNFPHIVTAAGFFSYITPQGDWKIHPTRDPQVWFSIGAPFVNPANPTRVSMNPLTRSGNVLTSVNPNFDARIINGGNFLKLEFQLKNGFVPPQSKVAFPLGAQGITRVGDRLVAAGETVMYLPAPVVYDANNREDVRQIATAFQSVSGQLYLIYTLPALTGMSAPVIDPTLTVQPDGTAGKDNRNNSGQTTWNYGASANMTISTATGKALIEFDVSSIPTGSICNSATFYGYQDASGPAGAWTCTVYSIAVGNEAWIEGTKSGSIAGAGEPCFNALAADGAGGILTPWAGSTNLGTSGTDYEATAIGSFSGNKSDANGTEYSTALTAARVQGWFGAVNTNYGIVIPTSANMGALAASEHATAAVRPKLVVDYSVASSIPAAAMHYARQRMASQ